MSDLYARYCTISVGGHRGGPHLRDRAISVGHVRGGPSCVKTWSPSCVSYWRFDAGASPCDQGGAAICVALVNEKHSGVRDRGRRIAAHAAAF